VDMGRFFLVSGRRCCIGLEIRVFSNVIHSFLALIMLFAELRPELDPPRGASRAVQLSRTIDRLKSQLGTLR
jgi:hypothetical protein